MTSSGMIMYVVVGQLDEGVEPPRRGRVFTTEDLAYAALGRLAVLHSTVGDMRVQEVEVISAEPAPEIQRPAFLDAVHPGPWKVGTDEDGSPEIADHPGRRILPVCLAGISGDEDEALAGYLVALVNADQRT